MILTTQYSRVLPLPASLAATSLLPKHNASRMRAAVGGFRGLVGMRSGVWIHVSVRLANGLVKRERALLEDTGITRPPLLRPTVDSRKRAYACGVFSVKLKFPRSTLSATTASEVPPIQQLSLRKTLLAKYHAKRVP